MRSNVVPVLVMVAVFGIPAAILFYVRHTYHRDLNNARNAPEVVGSVASGTVLVRGRVNRRTPLLKDDAVAYQESYDDRRTLLDGRERVDRRVRSRKQTLWLDTTAGVVKVEGDYDLSAEEFRYARVRVGTNLVVIGRFQQTERDAVIHAGLVHQGTRESLINTVAARSGGGTSVLVFAYALLFIGSYLVAVNTGLIDKVYDWTQSFQ